MVYIVTYILYNYMPLIRVSSFTETTKRLITTKRVFETSNTQTSCNLAGGSVYCLHAPLLLKRRNDL